MSPFLKSNYAKILVGVAAGLLALSLGWFSRQQREIRAVDEAFAARVIMTGRTYLPATWRRLAPGHTAWPKVPEQSAGRGWRYELFTPPMIYYDPGARSFAVTPPQDPAGEHEGGPGLPLAGGRPELFRLQLAGYFGAPDNYLLAFVSPGSPETLLARAGWRSEQLGLALKSFAVTKVPVEHDGTEAVYDVAGLATLIDERTGAEVVLDTRVRKMTDASLADKTGRTPELSTPRSRDVANNGP